MSLYSKYVLSRIINAGCGSKPIRKQREKVLPLCKGDVLEVGAGSGLNFSFYNEKLVSNVYALEPDEEMLRQARYAASLVNLNISFLPSGAEKIELNNNSVDTVLLTYTLCSIPDPNLALMEIRRVLKENGQLIFCEHGIAPDSTVKKLQNILNYVYPYCAGGCNLNRDIPGILIRNGFQIKQLDTMYLPGTPRWSGFNYWGFAT